MDRVKYPNKLLGFANYECMCCILIHSFTRQLFLSEFMLFFRTIWKSQKEDFRRKRRE